ncbi:hypothetical protein AAV35_006470 [Salimicrobium jeotgali]|uniref:Uncharacterized protein n=1 Tax=Salimicrobium jeotgali TaxID=1230341 RepID=K2HAV3_9BACI|nr:hypothetical protein [Salimicrobium jeotgali]AKG04465.1 hypothetical protein AAV35_006470 [Salimicrobium jeotgali]EKE32670.1 hypothetical protein MJ3_01892 [Salimicrobium jeotgali]MBM7695344.1 hypothetical protein [Salimicrobium jeotgali]
MSARLKNGLLSAMVFAVISMSFSYFVEGEIRWNNVIGLAIGGFVSWYFIIPRINKKRADKKKG